MDLIDVDLTADLEKLSHSILLIYSAVKSAAVLMKDFNAVK